MFFIDSEKKSFRFMHATLWTIYIAINIIVWRSTYHFFKRSI